MKTGNSAFFQKAEKDVWHALLSFQGTGSGLAADAPSHRRNHLKTPVLRRKFQITSFSRPGQRNLLVEALAEETESAFPGLGKNWKPFRVDAQYRCSGEPCQAAREAALNPLGGGSSTLPRCTVSWARGRRHEMEDSRCSNRNSCALLSGFEAGLLRPDRETSADCLQS